MHLDQRVAGTAAAEARTALATQPKNLPVVDPRRYRHVEPLFRSQGQAFLPAGRRLDEVDGEGEEAVAAAGPECPASRPGAPRRSESREKVLQIAQIHFPFGLVFAAAGAFGVSPII